VYPVPAFNILIDANAPPVIVNVPIQPEPPPPVIIKLYVPFVYPLPATRFVEPVIPDVIVIVGVDE
jgi:hypothetical protein